MLPRPLFSFLLCGLAAGSVLTAAKAQNVSIGRPDLNQYVLNAIGYMPTGGRYATTADANARLSSSIRSAGGQLVLKPDLARPSYCSGATYLAFLSAVEQMAAKGLVELTPELLSVLMVRGQPDGVGVWGRWNANGPGTARLFAEAGLGRSFTDWNQARRGDFMKIWWTNEIGHRERGHSVVYLGTEDTSEGPGVLFWSSNQPDGYGRKVVPRTKVKWAVFSRFERPEALARLTSLPKKDSYLASMLTRPSTRDEVARQCGFRE